MKKVAETVVDHMQTDVLSGGMILPAKSQHIKLTAPYILSAYPRVEELGGVKFGADYLWHLQHPEESDWYPNSEKPAIAMCIFKEIYPDRAVEFAADLQHALFAGGRDLTDDEAYRHLLEKYSLQPEMFYEKLQSEEYKEAAYYEFNLCKQLQVSGYPALFVQTGELKFEMVARGYTDFETVKKRIEKVLSFEF